MELGKIIGFRKDLYFEGAVQADWFYNSDKSSKVAENFVFHSSQYFGVEDEMHESKKQIDTISLVKELAAKLHEESVNPLSLAIAGYGTGKSHFAVTLAQIFSGYEYMPDTYKKVLNNISLLDKDLADTIVKLTEDRNFVIVLNGMRDFNLHSEILKAAQKSLHLYGLSDEKLRKLNRALETAEIFFNRNAANSIDLFEDEAIKRGWHEKGQLLIDKIRNNLMIDDNAFEIVNSVYKEINGQEISWDEGISASSILEMLISEYCGMDGNFDHVIIIFDEFGRYLEYASGVNAAKSGESALQQIFEVAQNAEGLLHVINFIQSDIKTYLQRVDQTKNISRYIGRYDGSDKYYISSNLETVFANLIHRKDKQLYENYVVVWQKSNESNWEDIFSKMNKWLIAKGMWKDYRLFRKVIIEGIYPLHPLSTFLLTNLQDYLQNRSSLTLISQYIEEYAHIKISDSHKLIMPEHLMTGDLFTEMLAAEQEGKHPSQHCIQYDNVISKYSDKLSEKSLVVLRSNLILRILRFRTIDYNDVKQALAFCSGLSIKEIEAELYWLENEYAVLGFDAHAGCFDFMEESHGAHNFRIIKKRLIANTKIEKSILNTEKLKDITGMTEDFVTNFGNEHNISTNEWLYKQELYPIEDFSEILANSYVEEWKNATDSTTAKGRIVWLYINKGTNDQCIDKVKNLLIKFNNTPIIVMLLNDQENRLYNCILEYYVLDNLDEINRKKYASYYLADFQLAENNLKDEISQLKKERLLLSTNGINELNSRMPVYLSSVFEAIYPNAVPFWFDGFITRSGNVSGKAVGIYCSIIKMLLSNSVNEVTIHNFGSDERNRIEALLMTSTETSWKCINENYRIIPPGEKNSREIYDRIYNKLAEREELSIENIFDVFCMPPYGMSEEVVMLIVAVFCSNLSYCLRVNYDGELININNWKDIVVQREKKIDLKEAKKSNIVLVDSDAIINKFSILFDKIKTNKNLNEVINLSNELEDMVNSEEVPEELENDYLVADKILSVGKKAKNDWSSYITRIKYELSNAVEDNNLYNAIIALELLVDSPVSRIFYDNDFEYDDESKREIMDLHDKIVKFIDNIIDYYISNMHCRSVTQINTFRNHNIKIQNKLEDLGFKEYANRIEKQKNNELNNIQEIKSREELASDYTKYIKKSKIDKFTPYVTICSLLKDGVEIQNRILKYKDTLGKNSDKIVSTINSRINDLNKAKDKITEDMNDIWNDLYEVENAEDVESLIERITLILQKGIESVDKKDFTEMQYSLNEILKDIQKIESTTDSRQEFTEVSAQIKGKYQELEFEFEVLPIIDDIIKSVSLIINQKEQDWRDKYLSLGDRTRESVHKWKDKTKYLPEYISEYTIKDIKSLEEEADKIISDGKVDDVIYYFKKLDITERKECVNKLKELI